VKYSLFKKGGVRKGIVGGKEFEKYGI